MIACPNCGGNTKFDIPSQQIKCEFCDSQFDPYSFDHKTSDAVEQQSFEATIFTCPQCGGEILSTDDAAAGFCSFCGASTILFSRISQEKRPNFIIPFKKTKEDCKAAYGNMMKKAIFAPKELKDPKYIDSFRGIYMPYWAFHLTQRGGFSLPGKKSYRRGDYIITDHFNLNGNIDAYYKGISYDASSSFADNISQALAPYDVKGMKAFTPAYLSGFYADTANVDSNVYLPDAEDIAVSESIKQIKKETTFHGYEITTTNPRAIPTHLEATDSTMFPVWFMSYRNGDRISYATVNGQTGKVVADLPVDIKKYLFGSLILAIPLYFLLNLFLTLTPSWFLIAVMIISGITLVTYNVELSSIKKRENYEDDKGMLFLRNRLRPNSSQGKGAANTAPEKEADTRKTGKIGGMALLVISMIISGCILFLHPIHDYAYYVGSILCLVGECITLMDAIKAYNILASRRLPQFNKEGGDDRA